MSTRGLTIGPRTILVLALLAAGAVLLPSCGTDQPPVEATPPAEATPAEVSAAEPTSLPTTTPTPVPAMAPTVPTTPEPAPPPEIAGLNSLHSYRIKIAWRIEGADGSNPVEATTSEERVRGDEPAMHVVAVVPDLGQPGESITAESIYLGTTAYARQPDGSWLAMEMTGWEEMGSDYWPVDDVQEWTPASEGSVNGIQCQLYTFALEFPPEGERTLPVHVTGELCVASQPDLPPVILRQWLRWEGDTSPVPFAGPAAPGQVLITTLDARLSDLNAPLAIEAPVIPTPVPPTPTPVPPTATSPPPTPIPPDTPTVTATATPTTAPQWVEQPPYDGDCKQRPAGTLCLGFDDGYIWLIAADTIVGWSDGEPWQGMRVQMAHGTRADYQHVLGTNLIKVVEK